MGKFHSEGDSIVQRIHMTGGGFGAIVYWNAHVFFACSDDHLQDYVLENGRLMISTSSRMKFENPGATPAVSASGTQNAVVWAVATKLGTA